MAYFFVFWINICGIFAHPVYVSITNMDIDAQNKHISLSLRMFADDAETVLHNKYGIDGWIGVQGEHRDARRLLCAYLDEKLTVEANHREKVVLTVDSIVVHEEALWVYMQGRTEDIIRHVTVQQRVLTDFFRTQSNLVIISTGKKEEGYKLDKGKDKIELTIE